MQNTIRGTLSTTEEGTRTENLTKKQWKDKPKINRNGNLCRKQDWGTLAQKKDSPNVPCFRVLNSDHANVSKLSQNEKKQSLKTENK